MVAIIFGRIILRRNRQIISHLSVQVLKARPEHGCGDTGSDVLLSKAMLFLRQASESRKNFPWAVWPAGESPQPFKDVTTLHPGAPDTSAPLSPIPFGHIIPDGQLSMIGTLWKGSW